MEESTECVLGDTTNNINNEGTNLGDVKIVTKEIEKKITNKKEKKQKKTKNSSDNAGIGDNEKVGILEESNECGSEGKTNDTEEEANTAVKKLKNKTGNKFSNAFKFQRTKSCKENVGPDKIAESETFEGEQLKKNDSEEMTGANLCETNNALTQQTPGEKTAGGEKSSTGGVESKTEKKNVGELGIAEINADDAAADEKVNNEKVEDSDEKNESATNDNDGDMKTVSKNVKNKSGKKFVNAFKFQRTKSCKENVGSDEQNDSEDMTDANLCETNNNLTQETPGEKNQSGEKSSTSEAESKSGNKFVNAFKFQRTKSCKENVGSDEQNDSEDMTDANLCETNNNLTQETPGEKNQSGEKSSTGEAESKSGNKFVNAFKFQRTKSCKENVNIDEQNDSEEMTDANLCETNNTLTQETPGEKNDGGEKLSTVAEEKKSGNKFVNAFKFQRTKSCKENVGDEPTDLEQMTDDHSSEINNSETVEEKSVSKLEKAEIIADDAASVEKDSNEQAEVSDENNESVLAGTTNDIDEDMKTVTKNEKNKTGNKFSNAFTLKRAKSCMKSTVDKVMLLTNDSLEDENTDENDSEESDSEEKNADNFSIDTKAEEGIVKNIKIKCKEQKKRLKKLISFEENNVSGEKLQKEKAEVLDENNESVPDGTTNDIDEDMETVSKVEKNKSGNKFSNAFTLKRAKSCMKSTVDKVMLMANDSLEDENTDEDDSEDSDSEEKNADNMSIDTNAEEGIVKNIKIKCKEQKKRLKKLISFEENNVSGEKLQKEKAEVLDENNESVPDGTTNDIDEDMETVSKDEKNKSGNKFSNAFTLKRAKSCMKSTVDKVMLMANDSLEDENTDEDDSEDSDSEEKNADNLSIDTNAEEGIEKSIKIKCKEEKKRLKKLKKLKSVEENNILGVKLQKEKVFQDTMKKVGKAMNLSGCQENMSHLFDEILDKSAAIVGEHGAEAGAMIGTLILPGVGTMVGRAIGGAIQKSGTYYLAKKADSIKNTEKDIEDESKEDEADGLADLLFT